MPPRSLRRPLRASRAGQQPALPLGQVPGLAAGGGRQEGLPERKKSKPRESVPGPRGTALCKGGSEENVYEAMAWALQFDFIPRNTKIGAL